MAPAPNLIAMAVRHAWRVFIRADPLQLGSEPTREGAQLSLALPFGAGTAL